MLSLDHDSRVPAVSVTVPVRVLRAFEMLGDGGILRGRDYQQCRQGSPEQVVTLTARTTNKAGWLTATCRPTKLNGEPRTAVPDPLLRYTAG